MDGNDEAFLRDRVPRTFAELVLADLARAQRMVRKLSPDPIDPQFRIATPTGDLALVVTLSDDPAQRDHEMRMVSRFMGWRKATGFLLASELYEPDSVYAVGVTAIECAAALSRITRTKKGVRFDRPEWLPRAALDPMILSLLPREPLQPSPEEVAELTRWFGVSGRFPALPMFEDGRIARKGV